MPLCSKFKFSRWDLQILISGDIHKVCVHYGDVFKVAFGDRGIRYVVVLVWQPDDHGDSTQI